MMKHDNCLYTLSPWLLLITYVYLRVSFPRESQPSVGDRILACMSIACRSVLRLSRALQCPWWNRSAGALVSQFNMTTCQPILQMSHWHTQGSWSSGTCVHRFISRGTLSLKTFGLFGAWWSSVGRVNSLREQWFPSWRRSIQGGNRIHLFRLAICSDRVIRDGLPYCWKLKTTLARYSL